MTESIDPTTEIKQGTNPAIIPTSKLEEDSYDWWARHAEVLAIKDAINPEIVLIGDSITHFWAGEPKSQQPSGPQAFASVFAPYRVLNLGFGWDRTQNVLWRLDHGEMDDLHPRVVIIHIGTNNTSDTPNARACTPDEIVAGIAAICSRIQSQIPDIKIILMKIFPREETPDHPRRCLINQTNIKLAEYAKSAHLTLVDLAPRMLKSDGTLPSELAPDFCHLSEAGYQIWADTLRPLLNALLLQKG